MLETLQRETFSYFERYANPSNGLIADKTAPQSAASIAAVGLGLSTYAVAAERGFLSWQEAIARSLAALRFFAASEQSPEPHASGYKGFYYHFLDMQSGRRAHACELSTIDTALLLAGMLTVACYFDGQSGEEREIRDRAEALYRRVDWAWAADAAGTIGHGWTPERGRIPYAWDCGYSEAAILYILALGSPTHPVPSQGYLDWTATFEEKSAYGIHHLYAGPLFIHQLSQVWLDFRGIGDERNRSLGFDYFENSRRATLVQRCYGRENPQGFAHYSENVWGLTASDGPGPAVRTVGGRRREFYGYLARGAPFGPDDGTVAPWAMLGSLPFAPRLVCDAARHLIERLGLKKTDRTGFHASFNATFPETQQNPNGWVAPFQFGLNEGPIVLMVENYLSGLVWNLFRTCPHALRGLRRAGFTGGWLDASALTRGPKV